jgi:protein-tyrosine phosphatase
MSRSPTVVLAYLVKYRDVSLRDAYEIVKLARPIIVPNSKFKQELVAFETEIHGSATCNIASGKDEWNLPMLKKAVITW